MSADAGGFCEELRVECPIITTKSLFEEIKQDTFACNATERPSPQLLDIVVQCHRNAFWMLGKWWHSLAPSHETNCSGAGHRVFGCWGESGTAGTGLRTQIVRELGTENSKKANEMLTVAASALKDEEAFAHVATVQSGGNDLEHVRLDLAALPARVQEVVNLLLDLHVLLGGEGVFGGQADGIIRQPGTEYASFQVVNTVVKAEERMILVEDIHEVWVVRQDGDLLDDRVLEAMILQVAADSGERLDACQQTRLLSGILTLGLRQEIFCVAQELCVGCMDL